MNLKNKENYPILALFILSTIFFLCQHKFWISWDFSSYVLNAKYLFYHGTYFEVYRPPLSVLLLGIGIIFGVLGEYLYILFVSFIFFYGNIKLSKIIFNTNSFEKDNKFIQFIFYFFCLSPFVFINGMAVGTELLGLALLELFLVQIITGKNSGIYLGLATLTRYNFLLFIPLLFVNKKIKKIIINLISFGLLLFPWLLFNYIKFGNWFTSIIDSYALNIYLRDYLIEPFNFLVLKEIIGWFFPFFIIGLSLSVIRIIKTLSIKKNKISLLFLVVSFIVIFDCYNIPLKITRYLFNLVLPVAFFSTTGLLFIKYRFKLNKKVITSILIIIFLIMFGIFAVIDYKIGLEYKKFERAGEDIKKLNLDECEILSPHWVQITYYTENVYPLGGNDIESSILNNKIILLFKNSPTIDDNFDISEINKDYLLYEDRAYFFMGKEGISNKNCSKKYTYSPTVVNNHCEILSKKFEILKLENLSLKFCELINP